MKLPSLQPRTRLAHVVAIWSADHGKFAAFNHAVFTALFQDDHDIGKLEILLQIAEKFGLNSKDLASGSHVYFYMQKVIHDEEMEIQADVRAVPPCVSNNKVLATGMQKILQLQQMLPLL